MTNSDSGRAVEIQLRWPPFDPDTVIASELPIAREYFRLSEETVTPCVVKIGDESGFQEGVFHIDSRHQKNFNQYLSTL